MLDTHILLTDLKTVYIITNILTSSIWIEIWHADFCGNIDKYLHFIWFLYSEIL